MDTKQQILSRILASKARELIDMFFCGRDFAAFDDEVDERLSEVDALLTALGEPSRTVTDSCGIVSVPSEFSEGA